MSRKVFTVKKNSDGLLFGVHGQWQEGDFLGKRDKEATRGVGGPELFQDLDSHSVATGLLFLVPGW